MCLSIVTCLLGIHARFMPFINHLLLSFAHLCFREDLFYRLNVFPISTLDLKSRVLDIPAISAHLLVRNAAEKTHPKLLSSDALDRLMQHDWPGNVRELDNVMQRAEILSYSDTIQAINIVFDNELITSPRNTMDALNSKLQARAL